jgi:hypothetical protein
MLDALIFSSVYCGSVVGIGLAFSPMTCVKIFAGTSICTAIAIMFICKQKKANGRSELGGEIANFVIACIMCIIPLIPAQSILVSYLYNHIRINIM